MQHYVRWKIMRRMERRQWRNFKRISVRGRLARDSGARRKMGGGGIRGSGWGVGRG
jgi:hypothetical protein